MQRFRAYDKQTNHMYYQPNQHIYLNIDGTCVNFQNGEELEVMFFVANGKDDSDVYQGDIVRLGRDVKKHNKLFKDEPKSQIADYKPSLGLVGFLDGSFVVECDNPGFVKYRDGEKYNLDFYGPEGSEFSWDEIEVLGNVKQHKIEDFQS